MIEGNGHGVGSGLLGAALHTIKWRIGKVGHRLSHPPEHEDSANAGSKQHGEPGEIRVVRPTVIRPKADAAVATERQTKKKNQKRRHRQDIEPAQVTGHPSGQLPETAGHSLVKRNRQSHKQRGYSS